MQKMKNVWKKLYPWGCVLLWLIFHAGGNLVSAVMCSASVAALCLYFIMKAQKKDEELSGDFSSYALESLSPDQMATVLLREELKKYAHEGIPVAKRTVLWRSILTPVFIIMHFLIINRYYDSMMSTFWCTVLTLLFTLVYVQTSTIRVLRRRAEKNPRKEFAQILREELCLQERHRSMRVGTVAGIALFAVSVVGFFVLHSAPQWQFAKVDGGYAVTSFKPALLAQQQAEVPAEYRGEPVVAIGKKAFLRKRRLETVTLPSTVRTIEKQAFRGCVSLKDIQLHEGMETIGSGAFMNCEKLEEITLPSTLTQLLGESFQSTGIRRIRIPEGVTEIRGDTFRYCSRLAEVELHNGIVDIHAGAFYSCSSLQYIRLPENITEIHANTFENCTALREIDIPDGVTRIAAHSFYGCASLAKVYVPDTVKEIRSSAFRECDRLLSITVPRGVIINERAFEDSPTKVYYRQEMGATIDFQPEPLNQDGAGS